MRTHQLAAVAGALLVTAALSACGSHSSGAQVPSLDQAGSPSATAAAGNRAAALHAAAKCIREHGVPAFQDPVLTADGQVFSDSRSIQNAASGKSASGSGVLEGIRRSCGTLMATAGLQPEDEPPAPAKLVQAGVKAAQCLRAHGLPNVQDPTSESEYTPGHGFGLTPNEVPAGGKADPAFQQATQACEQLLNEEIRQSTLGNLAHG